MANEKVLKGPYWTKNWIEAMWRFTNENFVNFDTGAVDYEALGKEEFQFRKALFFRNFKNSERAKMAFASAEDDYKNPVENGKKGGRPKKSPQDAPNGNAGVDMHDAGNGAASKSPTSCNQFTADGDTREDSQAKPDGSAITRNETRHIDALEPSANHYATRQAKNGEAATREGADVSITFSKNMRQTAKTRDTRASVRYAPPSCSPDDGNIYDQESSISTDNHQPEGLTGPSHGGSVASLEARESQARQSRQRTGGSSVRGMAKVAQPPVRSRDKNSRCPNSRDEFHAFVADNNLHEGLAEEWYAIHEAREWVDRDGNPIKDWRGALYNYCTKTEQKRRTA